MDKIFRLVGIQILTLISDTFAIKKKAKQNALYGFIVLIVLALSAAAFMYCYGIGTSLAMFGSIDILPAMMMTVTCVVVLITTINKVKGTLFGFRDYDMVMSLPVSTNGIVVSRLLLLYAFNMLFVFIVMVPMMIAYGILAQPEITFFVMAGLLAFFVPLVPIILASVVGTIIAYIASKFRRSNLLNIIITFVFFIGIMAFSFALEGSEEQLANMSEMLMDRINSTYPLAQLYYDAVIHLKIEAIIIFVTISLLSFIAFSFVISKIFIKLNTSVMTVKARSNYKMQELTQVSPAKALYQKELRRYFSCSIYVLNTAFGVVLLTIGTIALFFVDLEALVDIPEVIDLLHLLLPIFIGFCTIMCCTTASSISLEGKNLWIIKSLPVSVQKILDAKLAVNMTVVFPVLIDSILICLILGIDLAQSVLVIVFPMLCTAFIAVFGLIVNLKLPNFNWTTEVAVVKQGAPIVIAMIVGFIILGLPFIPFVILQGMYFTYVLAAYSLLLFLLTIGLYQYLKVWGAKRFLELN